jgi:hypothetical protein
MLRDKIKKKSTYKNNKSKTNNNEKNKNQDWYEYKLIEHIYFLKRLVQNPRYFEKNN